MIIYLLAISCIYNQFFIYIMQLAYYTILFPKMQ